MALAINEKKNEKSSKIVCYLLNGKRDYAKERKMSKLLSQILVEIQ